MATAASQVERSRREGLRVWWIVLLSLLTLIPLGVWNSLREPDTPAELVSAFFEAIRDKDLDRAFGYTDATVPTGESAAFLHPDAIGDEWEVLEVSSLPGEYTHQTTVSVTLGHPDGVATGTVEVVERHDEPTIENPFQRVLFPPSPQMAVQVNDRVVDRGRVRSWSDWREAQTRHYELLPGIYRFNGGEPAAFLETEAYASPVEVRTPTPEPTPQQLEALQTRVNERIDACLEYEVAAPPGCPFSTDGQVDTDDLQRLDEVEEVSWDVLEYPEATVVPAALAQGADMLRVEFTAGAARTVGHRQARPRRLDRIHRRLPLRRRRTGGAAARTGRDRARTAGRARSRHLPGDRMSEKAGGPMRRVLLWARPRRWSLLVEAVLAAALAAVALPVLAPPGNGDEAVGMVADYLEAVRDGDLDRARQYIAEPEPEADDDPSWLTAEALSSDWRIESVERRSGSERAVHAVIASGDRTAETVFHVGETEQGRRISNPYAYLSVPHRLLAGIELNGRVGPIESSEEYARVDVALFPGSYTLFGDSLSVPFLALPDLDRLDSGRMLTDLLTGDSEVEDRLNEDLAAWIDDCAESTRPAPEQCPFSAAGDYSEVDDGTTNFDEVGELTWEVYRHPRVRFNHDLRLQTVSPGWVTVTGTGIEWVDETEETIDGRCEISVSDANARMQADGGFEFSVHSSIWSTCYRAQT
ncbi:hypothetical protein [Glycomyces xiaoerkulensis]|uniref:hypothetical protein n=1 Tax=Glycomyces xiaoerkulensis TaxID=2038139 RepID=UPI000C257283|nr:hypothetical protein [Glycomyces xiaoerkulensis]